MKIKNVLHKNKLKRKADRLVRISEIIKENKPIQDLIDGVAKIWKPTSLPDDGGNI